ncbi:MAG: B3/4 domain-containing protein [Kordiimonas sp.]
MDLKIDTAFSKLGLETHMGLLDFDVEVHPSGPALMDAMEDGAETRLHELMGEAASTDPVISKIRAAFKATGKDPSRYRPSSEALTRRVISGKPLYLVNNVVDSGNLISLMTGVPIGCYDTEKLNGNLSFRIGDSGETYSGIGRSEINLEGLPILADETGAFGSPFSDSERTAVTEETEKLLFVVYGLNIDVAYVESAAEMADTLITRFCNRD